MEEQTREEELKLSEGTSEEAVQEELPAEELPVEETSVEEAPVEETPAEEAPAEETPAEEAPVEETPAEEAPAEEAPAEETPVEVAPVEETPVEEAPAEEEPVEGTEDEAPMSEEEPQEAPARKHLIGRNLPLSGERYVVIRFRLKSKVASEEEVPAEETPAEEAPEEETPAEETPVEEAPEEEAPAEPDVIVEDVTEEAAPDIGEIDPLELKGTLNELEYTATSIEGAPTKRAFVYLPEDYDPVSTYPVLYLLHGIGGGETEWLPGGNGKGNCLKLLEQLYAEEKLKKFVVVFPNGRTCADFNNIHNRFVNGKLEKTPNVLGFFDFEKELRADLIPAVEGAYSVSKDRAERALAGLSMGGMQAVNLGMCNCLDLFGWIGAFSMGPETVSGEEAGNAIAASPYPVYGVYLCCGTADESCYPIYRSFTGDFSLAAGDNLKEYKTEVLSGLGHTFEVWDHAFAEFVQFAFKK